jgi:DNA-binding GntR family transcriptional regulator
LRIERVKHPDYGPSIFEALTIRLDLLPGIDLRNRITEDVHALAQRYGIVAGQAYERISIASANPHIASLLGLPNGARLLQTDRVVETGDGTPLEWRVLLTRLHA